MSTGAKHRPPSLEVSRPRGQEGLLLAPKACHGGDPRHPRTQTIIGEVLLLPREKTWLDAVRLPLRRPYESKMKMFTFGLVHIGVSMGVSHRHYHATVSTVHIRTTYYAKYQILSLRATCLVFFTCKLKGATPRSLALTRFSSTSAYHCVISDLKKITCPAT